MIKIFIENISDNRLVDYQHYGESSPVTGKSVQNGVNNVTLTWYD